MEVLGIKGLGLAYYWFHDAQRIDAANDRQVEEQYGDEKPRLKHQRPEVQLVYVWILRLRFLDGYRCVRWLA